MAFVVLWFIMRNKFGFPPISGTELLKPLEIKYIEQQRHPFLGYWGNFLTLPENGG